MLDNSANLISPYIPEKSCAVIIKNVHFGITKNVFHTDEGYII